MIDIPELRIDALGHTFIQGPSGSGKSTLLNIIGGVIRPTRGKVWLQGRELTGLGQSARDGIRADSIGFIFQQFNLVHYLSAMDNVLLPCRFSRERLKRATDGGQPVDEAALKLLRALFPAHAPDFHRPVRALSVGQQQRVAAARALIGAPALIIADEPTSALDHDARTQFMDLLLDEAQSQGITLLFVSHDPTLSNRFDRVLQMRDFNRVADA